MPVLYLGAVRRRLRTVAAARVDRMAGALADGAPAAGADLRWRLTEDVRGFAAVYGIEIYGGHWPPGAVPAFEMRRGKLVAGGRRIRAAALSEALDILGVESWQGIDVPPAPGFRFRPLGATFVTSIFPPMQYTRGLSAEEARLAVEVSRLSAELLGLRSDRRSPARPAWNKFDTSAGDPYPGDDRDRGSGDP